MNPEKIAVLDLGTNTFNLLIAEKDDHGLRVLHKEKNAVKLGQGGITKGFISADAYARALKTVTYYKEIINQHNINRTVAVATSAFRNARNGYQLVKDIKDRTGIEVMTIGGEKEAELIYYGIKAAMDLGKSTSVVLDIGGGSVEFIICNNDKIFWKGSYEIGGQRLMDMFQNSDPLSVEDTQNLVSYLDEKLITFFEAAEEFKPMTLIGASGTFDTLAEIDCKIRNIDLHIEEEKEYTLMPDSFERIFFDLTSKNREERLQIPGMLEMRVDMIVLACSMVYFIIHKLTIQKIRVSSYSLKEGVLSQILEGKSIEGEGF
jgi:exopolyphosphatase / guanosine-5'-triphosphate,3'-diphosphate pyrophosphatase